jgi:hypothetical protein
MTWQFWSIAPVWVLAIVAVVIIGLATSSDDHLTWIGVALAGATILTFAIQLGIQKKEGFVLRAMTSIGVTVVILGVASGVLALLG